MFGRRKSRAGTGLWVLAGGVLVGLAAVLFVQVRARRKEAALPADLREIEEAVVHALRHDGVLRARAIDVAAIAPGIIELTGLVATEAEGHRAAAVAHAVLGVRTVLNRLDAHEVQQRLRPRAPASEASSRWYGMNVGMGKRRQARQTDPDRRDDHAQLLEQALEPSTSEALADLSDERTQARSPA